MTSIAIVLDMIEKKLNIYLESAFKTAMKNGLKHVLKEIFWGSSKWPIEHFRCHFSKKNISGIVGI